MKSDSQGTLTTFLLFSLLISVISFGNLQAHNLWIETELSGTLNQAHQIHLYYGEYSYDYYKRYREISVMSKILRSGWFLLTERGQIWKPLKEKSATPHSLLPNRPVFLRYCSTTPKRRSWTGRTTIWVC